MSERSWRRSRVGHSAQGNTYCIICWLYLLEYNNKYIQYVTNYIEYMSYKFGTIRVICFCCVINYTHRPNLGALPRGRGKAHRDGRYAPYGIACMFLFLQIGYKIIYTNKNTKLYLMHYINEQLTIVPQGNSSFCCVL